jgi:hypothetical protein
MKNKKISPEKGARGFNKGTTFIELLLYIAVFLVLMPILLMVSINSIRMEKQNTEESQISADSRFVIERVYDLIADARQINVADSVFDDGAGKISLIMQDDSSVIIKLNPDTEKVEITEDSVTSDLSSGIAKVKWLYFERIANTLNDPDIVLGVNVRLKMSGLEGFDVPQNYVVSANLERGDYDKDGCPDFIDKYPKHAECCGDADGDDVCDELDNCINEYNPFQEDSDQDGVGDTCDSSVFFPGGNPEGGGSGGGAFNCSPDNQLLALINQQPPMQSSTLKSILMASSPLSPTVLFALIDAEKRTPRLLEYGHFRQVFVANTKLPAGVLQGVIGINNLPVFNKVIITIADLAATYIPWLGMDRRNYANYQITLYSDAVAPATWKNRIKFYDASPQLGSEAQTEKTDVFMINAEGGSDTVIVKTQTSSGIETDTITVQNNYLIGQNGYSIELNQKTGNSYAFMISSSFSTQPLISVEFDFGTGANITSPTTTYKSSRYICYCEGGCAVNCGDVGTGIITTNVYTDRCYRWNRTFPEWCSYWETFKDDDSANSAFIGGTQAGEETVYWEKTFKTMLTRVQLANLKSITAGGQVAYQSITQFFCDTLSASCPMAGNLVNSQDIELYNWNTGSWVVIGAPNVNGSISDQQTYEVIYNSSDVLKFIGTGGNENQIKARTKFHWNGVTPQGERSAPCFMLIDYFTLHLKW